MASEDGQEFVFPAISPSRRISAKTFFCARLAVRSTFFCSLSWSNFVLLAISRRFLLSFSITSRHQEERSMSSASSRSVLSSS